MYNELQKHKYLENCKYEETTRHTIEMMFRAAARVERKFNLDLAEFNIPKVEELLKSYNSKSKRYLTNMCVYYSDYVNWCRVNCLTNPSNAINPYDSAIVKDIIERVVPISLIKGKFFSKEDVLEHMDCLSDVSNKFLLYAPFMGVKGQNYHELGHLKMSSLDEENKIIKLTDGRTLPVDDLFIELMKKTDQAEYYVHEEKNYINNKKDKYDSSIYVFKYCNNNRNINTPIGLNFISLRFATIKQQTGNKFLTVSTLYNNGLINFIKEHFKKQGKSLEEALYSKKNNKLYTHDDELQKLIYQFGSNKTIRMLRYELKDTIQFYI